MNLRVKTPATKLAVTVEFVKQYLRWIDTSLETNDIIEEYILAATELFEGVLDVSLVEKTYEMTFSKEEMRVNEITLLRPPHKANSVSVKRVEFGEESTITNFYVDDLSGVFNLTILDVTSGFFKVEFQSGYDNIPAGLKMALAEQVGNWYEGTTDMGELSKSVMAKIGVYSNNL